MAYNVLATDKVSADGLSTLHEDGRFDVIHVDDSSSEAFLERLKACDALVVRSATEVGSEMIDRASELKAIGRAGVGIDNVDLNSATARGIAVFNSPGGNTIAAAEMTMALMLSLIRKIPAAEQSVRDGKWDRAAFKGNELKGRTLGLIGAGRIGGEVATRCQAFGMDCIVYDPYLTQDRAEEINVRLVDLDNILDDADVISIHVPLTDETRGLVDEKALSRMRNGVFVINASRGGVIHEPALADALKSGEIAGAALDVYEQEPLPDDSPLRDVPNLVLTPHLAGSTAEAQVEVAREIAVSIMRSLLDGDASGAINASQLR
jgi:D-3-phosphoglycerate dehydrogenase / 2-oxoglutarate reductase